MVVDSLIENCPSEVRELIEEICLEPTTESVWLIGSRAESSVTENSDWDFLVFSSVEPACVPRRRMDVDIVRVGPSGRVLTEGAGEQLAFEFQDFQWTLLDDERASYIGRRFRPFPAEGARDAEEPVLDREDQVAFLICRGGWRNEAVV